jgi:hypothetical protein
MHGWPGAGSEHWRRPPSGAGLLHAPGPPLALQRPRAIGNGGGAAVHIGGCVAGGAALWVGQHGGQPRRLIQRQRRGVTVEVVPGGGLRAEDAGGFRSAR